MTLRPSPLFALMFFAVAGCAHGPGVSSDDLSLRRVVVYRNGVGYFEREGKVSGDQVSFQVRPSHVGDFLATLSVMERGGSSVRSVSFPMHLDETPEPSVPGAPSKPKKAALETVTLALDGKAHDLAVGYVAEQPVWRPSYRIVVDAQGATLQAWGIVQNLSGEDWRDVSLSLVAGAPIAFRSTLGTPVTPARPVLSDFGETITEVPTSENSFAPPSPAPGAPMMSEPQSEALGKPPTMDVGSSMTGGSDYIRRFGSARSKNFSDSAARQGALLASASLVAGTTRYDLPQRVTIPKDSATMVLLTARSVPGESIFLFAPNSGVADSAQHPFRVVRFTNSTSGMLERGPIAVFDQDSFLGQGVLEQLSAGGKAIVPFALDRSVGVSSERTSSVQGARLAHIEAGLVTLDQSRVDRTVYRVQNGSDAPVKIILKHTLAGNARLLHPPAGTESDEGKASALVPALVPRGGKVAVNVDEQQPFRNQVDWTNLWVDEAIAAYVKDPRAEPALRQALVQVTALTKKLRDGRGEQGAMERQDGLLKAAADQARASLKAIAKSAGAEDLRRKLLTRLSGLETQLGKAEKRTVELQFQVDEAQVRLNELVRDLRLDQPLLDT